MDRADPEIEERLPDPLGRLPDEMRRTDPPALPELSQVQVLRHYLRLSQMTLGFDLTPDASSGTCTMKYSPRVNEEVARGHRVRDLHPLQDAATLQGILRIVHDFGRMMCEISGMDEFSFQPASGAQGIFTNACIIRAYHESAGRDRPAQGDHNDRLLPPGGRRHSLGRRLPRDHADAGPGRLS